MEIETVMLDKMGGHYLQFQHETLIRAWEWVAGTVRPVPAEITAMQTGISGRTGVSKFRKSKMPKQCTGSYSTLFIIYSRVSHCVLWVTGKAVRLNTWDHHESELLDTYHVRLLCVAVMLGCDLV